MKKGILIIACILLMAAVAFAGSDEVITFYLNIGGVIEVNHAWEEDGMVMFYRYGTLVKYPMVDVERIDWPEEEAEIKTPQELEEDRLREELGKKRLELKKYYKNLMVEKERVEGLKSTDTGKYLQEIQSINEKVEDYNTRKANLDAEVDAFNKRYGQEESNKKKKKK